MLTMTLVRYLAVPLVVVVGGSDASLDGVHPCVVVSLRVSLQDVRPATIRVRCKYKTQFGS